eukprot:7878567-Pyramimonas_sp.AAC.1
MGGSALLSTPVSATTLPRTRYPPGYRRRRLSFRWKPTFQLLWRQATSMLLSTGWVCHPSCDSTSGCRVWPPGTGAARV